MQTLCLTTAPIIQWQHLTPNTPTPNTAQVSVGPKPQAGAWPKPEKLLRANRNPKPSAWLTADPKPNLRHIDCLPCQASDLGKFWLTVKHPKQLSEVAAALAQIEVAPQPEALLFLATYWESVCVCLLVLCVRVCLFSGCCLEVALRFKGTPKGNLDFRGPAI